MRECDSVTSLTCCCGFASTSSYLCLKPTTVLSELDKNSLIFCTVAQVSIACTNSLCANRDSLVELGVRDGAAGDDGFIVSKHDWPINGNTEVAQSETEIDDLIGGCSGCHKLGTRTLINENPKQSWPRVQLITNVLVLHLMFIVNLRSSSSATLDSTSYDWSQLQLEMSSESQDVNVSLPIGRSARHCLCTVHRMLD